MSGNELFSSNVEDGPADKTTEAIPTAYSGRDDTGFRTKTQILPPSAQRRRLHFPDAIVEGPDWWLENPTSSLTPVGTETSLLSDDECAVGRKACQFCLQFQPHLGEWFGYGDPELLSLLC